MQGKSVFLIKIADHRCVMPPQGMLILSRRNKRADPASEVVIVPHTFIYLFDLIFKFLSSFGF